MKTNRPQPEKRKEAKTVGKYPTRIKLARTFLKETMSEFAKRFGVSATAVSLWESGDREAPYRVLEFAESVSKDFIECETCGGKGYINLRTVSKHKIETN